MRNRLLDSGVDFKLAEYDIIISMMKQLDTDIEEQMQLKADMRQVMEKLNL